MLQVELPLRRRHPEGEAPLARPRRLHPRRGLIADVTPLRHVQSSRGVALRGGAEADGGGAAEGQGCGF